MLRSGKEPPRFRSADQLVQATLVGGPGNKSFVRFVADLSDPLDRDVDVLLALSVLRRKRTVDALVLAGVIQRSPADAQQVLQRMTEAHITEPAACRSAHHPFPHLSAPTRTRSRVSGRALTYHRRQLDVADDKVLEHIQEYGYITNRTVQRMFDVDVYRARNLLADMRGRGLIAKIGEGGGGPGVRYGLPDLGRPGMGRIAPG